MKKLKNAVKRLRYNEANHEKTIKYFIKLMKLKYRSNSSKLKDEMTKV